MSIGELATLLSPFVATAMGVGWLHAQFAKLQIKHAVLSHKVDYLEERDKSFRQRERAVLERMFAEEYKHKKPNTQEQ